MIETNKTLAAATPIKQHRRERRRIVRENEMSLYTCDMPTLEADTHFEHAIREILGENGIISVLSALSRPWWMFFEMEYYTSLQAPPKDISFKNTVQLVLTMTTVSRGILKKNIKEREI